MVFSKTWLNDATDYVTLTERALNKVEAEAAKMWLASGTQSWSTADPFLSTPSGARALDTYYQNDTDYPMLVIASLRATPETDLIGGDAAEGVLEITDSNQLNPDDIGPVRANPPLVIGVPSFVGNIGAVVNPGEHYRIRDDSDQPSGVPASPGGTVTIADVQELLLDVTYTAQTWATGNGPSATPGGDGTDNVAKLNNYVDGINAIPSDDSALSRTNIDAHNTQNTTQEDAGSELGLISGSMRFPQPLLITNPVGTVEASIEDSGDPGLTQVETVEGLQTTVAALGAQLDIPFCFLVNGGGDWTMEETGGAGDTDIPAGLGHRFDLTPGSSANFPAIASGVALSTLRQQFIDMDDHASRGLEVENSSMTRSHPSLPYTAPSDSWALVAVHVSISPNNLNLATSRITLSTEVGTDSRVSAASDFNADLGDFQVCMFIPVGAGDTLSTIASTGAAAIQKVTVWEAN